MSRQVIWSPETKKMLRALKNYAGTSGIEVQDDICFRAGVMGFSHCITPHSFIVRRGVRLDVYGSRQTMEDGKDPYMVIVFSGGVVMELPRRSEEPDGAHRFNSEAWLHMGHHRDF